MVGARKAFGVDYTTLDYFIASKHGVGPIAQPLFAYNKEMGLVVFKSTVRALVRNREPHASCCPQPGTVSGRESSGFTQSPV